MPRQSRGRPSLLFRWSVFAAIALFACGGETRVSTESAPVLGSIPDFVLIDQNSKPFGTEQLRGSVWIADFIFTSCPDMCPMLSTAMASVRGEIREDAALQDVRFVSISVDPDTDTPAVLAEYAEKYAAAGVGWSFLKRLRLVKVLFWRKLRSSTRRRAMKTAPSGVWPRWIRYYRK